MISQNTYPVSTEHSQWTDCIFDWVSQWWVWHPLIKALKCWCLGGDCRIFVHTGYITMLDCMQLLTCMQLTICINAARLQLCVLEQNSRCRVMYTEDLVILDKWTHCGASLHELLYQQRRCEHVARCQLHYCMQCIVLAAEDFDKLCPVQYTVNLHYISIQFCWHAA